MENKEWKTFNAKVLIAEDNPANRVLIDTILKKHGIETTVTEDGKQAVEAAQVGSFDLILMDMQMPVMNGFEATRMLREKGFTLPIIALTASVMVGDREKCIEAGCNDFVSKPINRQRLQEVLEASLNHSDAEQVTQQVEQLSEQASHLNKLVKEATPTAPQSILNEEREGN